MRIRHIAFVLVIAIIAMICVGCSVSATIPHSSDEYENGDWSVEELVEHFEGLGFTDIKVEEKTTFDESEVKIQVIVAEDSDSWSPSYRDFEKGETISTLRKIIIRETALIPVITVDNCAEFAKIVEMDAEAPEKADLLSTFMQENDGEYLEFDGTITDWYDELWFSSGVSFTISVEDSGQLHFSWGSTSLIDLGMTGDYHHNKYKTGLITEGMKVHVLAKIDYADDDWSLEIDTLQIIE